MGTRRFRHNFDSGFVSFVRSAILRYYEAGKEKEANEMFDFLRKKYPGSHVREGAQRLHRQAFLIDRELGDHRVAMSRIGDLVRSALLMYSYDEDEQAGRRLARARQVYDMYQKGTSSDRMKIRGPSRRSWKK